MKVVRFGDEYSMLAALTGLSVDEATARDARHPDPVQRWIAIDGDRPRAAVTAIVRPDERIYLSPAGDDHVAIAEAARNARQDLNAPVHMSVDEADARLLATLEEAGFETRLVAEYFTVAFDAVLVALRRAWVPTGYSIHPIADGDPNELFRLDNTLRARTPGTDGWRGNRTWFDSELEDPAAYHFARHGDDAVGLVRVWRNADGPRFGFIGVLPDHRGTPLAAALIRTALEEADGWGHKTFVTETALTNRAIHPRLTRLGAESDGRFRQMVLR